LAPAVFIVMFATLATAATVFEESFGALVLDAQFGFAVWWVMFFGPPAWLDGANGEACCTRLKRLRRSRELGSLAAYHSYHHPCFPSLEMPS
jgi:hypothetical protein